MGLAFSSYRMHPVRCCDCDAIRGLGQCGSLSPLAIGGSTDRFTAPRGDAIEQTVQSKREALVSGAILALGHKASECRIPPAGNYLGDVGPVHSAPRVLGRPSMLPDLCLGKFAQNEADYTGIDNPDDAGYS